MFAGGERRWASRVGGDSRGETFSRGLRNRRRGGGNGAFTAELVRKTKPPFVSFAFFFQSVAIFSFFLRLDDFKVPNSLDSLITQLWCASRFFRLRLDCFDTKKRKKIEGSVSSTPDVMVVGRGLGLLTTPVPGQRQKVDQLVTTTWKCWKSLPTKLCARHNIDLLPYIHAWQDFHMT